MEKRNYELLTEYFMSQTDATVHLRFSEIENILKFALPDSARRSPSWWHNKAQAPQANAWLVAGYKTEDASSSIKTSIATFVKIDSVKVSPLKKVFFKKSSSFLMEILAAFLAGLLVLGIQLYESKTSDERKLLAGLNSDIEMLDSRMSRNEYVQIISDAPNIIARYKHLNRIELCDAYRFLCEAYSSKGTLNFTSAGSACSEGLNYAKQCNSIEYQAYFLNTRGNLHLLEVEPELVEQAHDADFILQLYTNNPKLTLEWAKDAFTEVKNLNLLRDYSHVEEEFIATVGLGDAVLKMITSDVMPNTYESYQEAFRYYFEAYIMIETIRDLSLNSKLIDGRAPAEVPVLCEKVADVFGELMKIGGDYSELEFALSCYEQAISFSEHFNLAFRVNQYRKAFLLIGHYETSTGDTQYHSRALDYLAKFAAVALEMPELNPD